MTGSKNRKLLIGGWMGAMVTLAAVGVASGVTVTLGAGALWLVACFGAPVVLMRLWSAGPPPTAAEVINSTERRS